MILVAKSFVSANIGRARRVSSREKVAGSRSCALSAGHSSGTLVRHQPFLQPSFRLTLRSNRRLRIGLDIFHRSVRLFCLRSGIHPGYTQKMGSPSRHLPVAPECQLAQLDKPVSDKAHPGRRDEQRPKIYKG